MLRIYGANLSAPSNKVRMTVNAMGLDYEYVQVKVRENEHKQDWYLQINPVGKIPSMNDDGFTLFESNAICKYLIEKNNGKLYLKDLKERAAVDAWVDFITIHVFDNMRAVAFNKLLAPLIGREVDESALKIGVEFLNKYLPLVDSQLGKHKNVAGDKFSFADIVLVSSIDQAEVVEYDISQYLNLDKWRKKQMQKNWYTQCHTTYGEAVKQFVGQ
jgi:glutathione S-transferase